MKKILPFCLLAIGFGFAQDPMGSPPPAASETKLSFDAVRGHAYNPFGITGAPSTVLDLITTPSDIHGKKFFYVSPTDQLGYVAFNALGGSTLLGMNTSGDLVLGYATPAFGLALEYTIRKQWTEVKTDVPATAASAPFTVTTSTRTTRDGDNIRLNFSLPLGSSTAYANVGWLTDYSNFEEIEGMPNADNNGWTKEDYSTVDANFGLLGNAGAMNYDASLSIERSGGTLTSSYKDFSSMGEKAVTDDSYLSLALNLDLGYEVLKNETARVLLGANNSLGAMFLDEVDDGDPVDGDTQRTTGGSRIVLSISPNILGEVIISEHWIAFVGATHDLAFIFGGVSDNARDKNYSETNALQTPTRASLGFRYQKDNWAFETQIINNNPFAAFSGDQIFTKFGGFIYF